MFKNRFFSHKSLLLTCFFLLLSPVFSAAAQAQDPFANNGNGLSTLGDESAPAFLRVEEAYQVQVHVLDDHLELAWYIEPNYYLYQSKFKFRTDGQTLPAEFEKGKVKYDEYFQEDVEVFYDSTLVKVNNAADKPYNLKVTSQGCADAGLCYPPYHQYFEIDPINKTATEVGPPTDGSLSVADETEGLNTNFDQQTPFNITTWLTSIIFALIGGMILNLMPCVFPVLSIKVLSLANSKESQHKMHLHGWAYSVGCVFTFVVIASIMLALRASGEAVGWGFQLQSPAVITALLYVFFLMGLSFSGVINLGSSLMGVGQNSTQGNKLHHSWMTGALASVVASPCTAPMMGAALGYAITQPAYVALSIFAALGFGMALPFLLLTYLPKAASLLPRPGAWMDTLKQFLAFPLYLSCVWLLWVLANQTNNNHLALVICGLVAIAFALWLAKLTPSKGFAKWFNRFTAVASVAFAIFVGLNFTPAKQDELWLAYSPERLSELRDQDKPVFVNLTASWCITCLANERVALGTDAVRGAMAENGVQGLKGDWTNADPQITDLLKQYGRSGVPLYLYYPADKQAEAIILPQLLTTDIVLQAITSSQESEVAEL